MQNKRHTGYHELTVPWEFRADNGLALRGRRAEGRGTMLHFLSGNGFCGGVYWPFLRPLLPDYGLFTNDIEGHGESEAPERFSGISRVLGRIEDVIAAQNLKGAPMIGMGHSFGAGLTVCLAARNPGMFRALVLLDPILFPTGWWWGIKFASAIGRHPMASGARRRRTAWPGRDDALAHLSGRGIYKGWTEEAMACFVDHAMRPRDGQHVLACPTLLEAQIFEHPVYPWRAMRKIDCPILFLHGAQSYEFFPAATRAAKRSNPRVEVQTLPGGHCFMQEDPAAAHAAVRAFLERCL